MARELSAAYEAERAVWQDRLAVARRRVVDELVRTGRAPDGAEQVLGFPLTGHHLTGVLWSVDSSPHEDAHGEHRRYITRLTAAAGARGVAVLDNPDGTTNVLWSFPARPPCGLTDLLLRSVERPRHTVLVLGPVGHGASGLQQSVLGARQARVVAVRRRIAAVSCYEDVALLALLLAGEDSAGRFVRGVLAGLTRTGLQVGCRQGDVGRLSAARSRAAPARGPGAAAGGEHRGLPRQAGRGRTRPAGHRTCTGHHGRAQAGVRGTRPPAGLTAGLLGRGEKVGPGFVVTGTEPSPVPGQDIGAPQAPSNGADHEGIESHRGGTTRRARCVGARGGRRRPHSRPSGLRHRPDDLERHDRSAAESHRAVCRHRRRAPDTAVGTRDRPAGHRAWRRAQHTPATA